MVICLGSQLEAGNKKLSTSIEQSLFRGEYEVDNTTFSNYTNMTYRNNVEIIHNGIKYSSIENTEIKLSIVNRASSWKEISLRQSGDTLRDQVFYLTIPHSKEVSKYAYSISTPEGNINNYQIVSNEGNLQAVLDKRSKKLLLVAWQDQVFQYRKNSYSLEKDHIYVISKKAIISESVFK